MQALTWAFSTIVLTQKFRTVPPDYSSFQALERRIKQKQNTIFLNLDIDAIPDNRLLWYILLMLRGAWTYIILYLRFEEP